MSASHVEGESDLRESQVIKPGGRGRQLHTLLLATPPVKDDTLSVQKPNPPQPYTNDYNIALQNDKEIVLPSDRLIGDETMKTLPVDLPQTLFYDVIGYGNQSNAEILPNNTVNKSEAKQSEASDSMFDKLKGILPVASKFFGGGGSVTAGVTPTPGNKSSDQSFE